MEELRRRRFFVCAAAATASTVSLAGCQGINRVGEVLGQDEGNGDEGGSATGSGSTFVRNALYTPDIHDEIDHYGYFYASPGTVADHEDTLSEGFVETFASVEDRFEQLGFDFDSITDIVYYNRGQTAVSATIPVETVRERLDSMGFRRQSTDRGFELFANPGSSSLIGLSEELLLTSRSVGSMSAGDVLETMIDLRDGQTDGYAEEFPPLASVLGALGETTVEVGRGQSPPEVSSVSQGQFEGVVARGMGVALGDSESTVRMAFAFDENVTPDTDGIERWLDENDNMQEPFSALEGIETETEDRTVVVTGAVPTANLHPDMFPSF